MVQKSRLPKFVFAAIVTTSLIASPLATAENRAPAGQICPKGSYVIGFDSESNIICSELDGKADLNADQSGGDGKAESGDSCPPTCPPAVVDAGAAEEKTAGETMSTDADADADAVPTIPDLVISDVKPSKVLFGKAEMAITVIGAGFTNESVIVFAGSTYSPSVNQAGTQLVATIVTRDLYIGAYAIKVSNGSGLEATLKKALVVY